MCRADQKNQDMFADEQFISALLDPNSIRKTGFTLCQFPLAGTSPIHSTSESVYFG